MQQNNLEWFATRAIKDRPYVLRYLEVQGVQTAGISDIKSLIFIHCPLSEARTLKSELWDRVLFYRGAESRDPQAIPDGVMNTFLLMAPFHKEPVIYLPVDKISFFEGQRKRVTKGAFKGCEGVIRRIKGERRLIVKLSDRAAIATPYIPQNYLEDIDE